MIRSAVWTTLRSLLRSDLVAKLNQTGTVQPLLGLFFNGVYVIVPLQVLGDGGAQEHE